MKEKRIHTTTREKYLRVVLQITFQKNNFLDGVVAPQRTLVRMPRCDDAAKHQCASELVKRPLLRIHSSLYAKPNEETLPHFPPYSNQN